jgi:hypothetical protein
MKKIHLLPCKIAYDGKAAVASYFENAIRSTNTESKIDKADDRERNQSNSIIRKKK